MSNAVRLKGISKLFGSVKALQNVDLEVQAGTMHAIVGENGAGKTTLMRILYGVIQPDEGEIVVEGRAVTFRNSSEAGAERIGMVSQHYSVISELTCLQNLILGAEPSIVVNYGSARKRAEALAEEMKFEFDWDAPASRLSPASKQRLEILKLLWRNSKVMILDEPTAMLSPADSDALFESMVRLIEKGATVLLVTHRLPEVMRYCRRVTVMRAGTVVGDFAVAETDPSKLAGLIMGSSPQAVGKEMSRTDRSAQEPILRVKGLTVLGDRGHEAISNLSLEVRAGEIVGIAGVDGNGQSELIGALAGLLPVTKGEIELWNGLSQRTSTLKRIEHGLRIIPEDRHLEGVIEAWSLADNAALGLASISPLSKGLWLDTAEEKQFAQRVVDRFKTRYGGLEKPMASLSGGNQQRVVVARALELGPKFLLAFQPVRGLDLGATANIYAAIREECAKGMAAIVVSFDLDELLEHCDRILVLNHGRLFDPGEHDRLNRERIGKLMVGAA